MKPTIRLHGEKLDLVNQLKEEGINAKLIKGATIVEPELKEGGKYDIPRLLLVEPYDYIPLIDAVEAGGGCTNTGFSEIICSISGKKLKPYYVPRKGHLCNGSHAYFAVPYRLVRVEADKDEQICITKYELDKGIDENKIRMHKTELWSGEYGYIPNIYKMYFDAIDAAIEKAFCYHCREPHYIRD